MAPPSNPVIERMQFTAKHGTDVPDLVNKLVTIITSPRPPGFLSGVWGTTMGNHFHVELWIIWDSITSHTAFLTPSKSTAIKGLLIPNTTSLPPSYHLTFPSNPLPLLLLPLTELQTFHGPSNIHFPSPNPHASLPTFKGQVLGKAIEKVAVKTKEGKKEERSTVVVVVGWDEGKGKEGMDKEVEEIWRKERDVRGGYQFLFRGGEDDGGIERHRGWVRFREF